MNLPAHLVTRLSSHGLVVSGPWQKDQHGWLGRYTVGAGEEVDTESGIRLLKGPVLWIYEDHGVWFVEKHQWVPYWVPGLPSPDFRCEYATAEDAVDKVLRFFHDIRR
jgi:hypothetical protein